MIIAESSHDYLGIGVSGAGDFNGDGLDDLIVGAHGATPNGTHSGASYLVYSSWRDTDGDGVLDQLDAFPNNANEFADLDGDGLGNQTDTDIDGDGIDNASDTDNDNDGVADAQDAFPYDATETADLDGDGIGDNKDLDRDGDAVANADDAFPDDSTEWLDTDGDGEGNHVDIDDNNDGIKEIIELAQLSQNADASGFAIHGTSSEDRAGISVADAGDVNGDGLDDVIVGAYWADPNGDKSGAAYVFFGRADGTQAELSQLELGASAGFVINGASANDNAGFDVSGAGDVNGDGLDDLIVSALYADPNGDNSGASYVVFGKATFEAVELSQLEAGGPGGFVINGANAEDRLGHSVSGAGDVNGDGLDDLIVGAYLADPNGNSNAGSSYVVFGKTETTPVEASQIEAGSTAGFVINGKDVEDRAGVGVSGAGDVNGDGLDDVLIGAYLADPHGTDSGAAYLVFGKTTTEAVQLSDLEAGSSAGFYMKGNGSHSNIGFNVAGAGDVNGDGLADLVIGAYRRDYHGGDSGAVYVVFGKATTDAIQLNQIGSGGFVIKGTSPNDNAGRDVAGVGDVNGDGLADVIIGAHNADPNSDGSGAAYVVYGKASTDVVELGSIESGEAGVSGYVINGIGSYDHAGRAVGGGGDINGDGRSDILVGAYYANSNGNNSGSAYVVYGPWPDQDWDGVPDHQDAFVNDPTETLDTDNDGIGNNDDDDDDGDGILDSQDAFPLDPDETLDTDGDGIGNNADTDDDGNGLEDVEEASQQINKAVTGIQSVQSGSALRFKVGEQPQNPANCNNAEFYVIEETNGMEAKQSLLMSAFTGNRTLSFSVHPTECSSSDHPKVINLRYGEI